MAIFLMTLIGEFGFSLPYLMETVWLLTGYQVISGALPPESLVLFFFTGLIGREIGAVTLYRVSGMGRNPLVKLSQRLLPNCPGGIQSTSRFRRIFSFIIKFIATFILPPTQIRDSQNDQEIALFGKVIRLSPLSVAMGRFTWLKIPITITMGITKQLLILIVGVGLFSLVWDGLYISIGVLGAGDKINPVLMLVSTISAFMTINIIAAIIRHHLKNRNARRAEAIGEAG